jgi:signal transduction histidine kinase
MATSAAAGAHPATGSADAETIRRARAIIWISVVCIDAWIILLAAVSLGFHSARPLGVVAAGVGMALCWLVALHQMSTGRLARGVAIYTISGLLLLLVMGMFIPELSLLFTFATLVFIVFGLSFMSGRASFRIVALAIVVALILLVTSIALRWTSGVPAGPFRWINLTGMLMVLFVDAVMFIMLRRTLEARADRLVSAERQAVQFQERVVQQERLESLGQLAGGIAHDFNNLLSVILNYGVFVAEATADRPEVLSDVEQIQAAAERAVTLTQQLLIFGRREVTQPEPLDLNTIVEDVQSLLSRSIGEHIVLRVEPVSHLPRIRADRGQVEQVLLNLAVNARDAMPEGGSLTIATRVAELDDSYSRVDPPVSPGRYVELEVSDSGTGMSADVSAHIFEPFFTTKPTGQGTGLGLSTVYGIMTKADGGMSVHSEEGVGTTFRLYFPATDEPVAMEPPDPEAYEGGQGETIIIVDDESSVLEVTSRILSQNGYVTFSADTCEEALSLVEAHDFQLLLTDSVMPHMSGSTLARRVEELRPGRPVLFMSGYGGGDLSPQRIVEEGVAFIQKPFNRRALLEKVRTMLREGPPEPQGRLWN